MPVREVLATHSSWELSEWMAYEKAYGPIDDDWRDNTLGEVHELLQGLVHLTAATNSKDGKSPETVPKRHVRPYEIWEEHKKRIAKGDIQ